MSLCHLQVSDGIKPCSYTLMTLYPLIIFQYAQLICFISPHSIALTTLLYSCCTLSHFTAFALATAVSELIKIRSKNIMSQQTRASPNGPTMFELMKVTRKPYYHHFDPLLSLLLRPRPLSTPLLHCFFFLFPSY